jgi:ABC-type transporter Mla MlaB component
MLRVTRIERQGGTTLKLEGKLAGPWVDEVTNCWTKLVDQKIHVEVDLEGLSFVDASGTALLLRMERQGSRLLGGSAFIRCLLHPELFRQIRSHHESTSKES